jgi:type II secretory pathway component PulM
MSRNLAEYYHWEEADKGIRIYMNSGMADRLQAEVADGTEAGGILLGRAEQDGEAPVVVIDDFVPVPCSHSAGPLYDLSGEDTVNLEAALLRTALEGCESPDAPVIVGYYRSHIGDGLSLSSTDLLTIDSYFQAPASVFLLVKAVAGSNACTAGFFFWEDGRIQSEFSSLEVALGRTPSLPDPDRETAQSVPAVDDDLPAELAELFRKAALPSDAPAPEPAPPTEQPVVAAAQPAQPGKTRHAWAGLLLRGATILIASAALVISVVTYLGAPRPPREQAAASLPAVSTLGLQVERTPPDLLVIWNRNAREIVAARRATLTIRDGGMQQTLDLDKTQLALGSKLYTPVTDDIQLRLEVYGADDGSVSQSIRVPPGGAR